MITELKQILEFSNLNKWQKAIWLIGLVVIYIFAYAYVKVSKYFALWG